MSGGRWRIAKKFCFEAAHHLPHLPPSHKCARPHGHSYVVEMILESDALDNQGFVLDFADLDVIGSWIAKNWDHRDLNTLGIYAPTITTSENLARWLYQRFVGEFPGFELEVRVSETPKTWASYREDHTT